MTRTPSNTYQTGEPLPTELHAIGRPVAYYTSAGHVIAGTITHVARTAEGLRYEIQAAGGGRYLAASLGDWNYPKPNTFTYAP